MKFKNIIYLLFLSVFLVCGKVATADEIIGEPKELVLQNQQVVAEAAEKVSVSLKEQEAVLTLSEEKMLFQKATAKFWTTEDRSDIREVAFERNREGHLQARIPQGDRTSVRMHVSVQAEAADATIYEVKDYYFDWLIDSRQTTTSTLSTSTTTFSTTGSSTTTTDTASLTSTLPSSTTRVSEPQTVTEAIGIARGHLSVKNHNTKAGTFEVIVSNVSLSTGIKTVKLPIWTEEKGQDDLKWYTATRQSNGTYKVTVQKKHHKNGTGLYHIHLYYENKAGKMQGVTSTTTSLVTTGRISIINMNPTAGTFDLVIRSVASPRPIQSLKVPVWTEEKGQDDLKWYTATRQSDGSYKVSISKRNHQNGTGIYHAHLYYTYSNGQMEGISSTKLRLSAPSTGKLTILNHNYQKGSFDVVISQVKSSFPLQSVKVPVWTYAGGQDDLKWYTAKRQSNGTYKVTIQKSHHKNDTGLYHVHLYYHYKNRKSEGIAAAQTALATTGRLNIKNVNHQNGSFDVIVSQVASTKTIQSVKIPVWTDAGGQDDVRWYTAKKQADGTYKVTIQKSDHKNGVGTYHVHLYYSYSNGTMKGIATTEANLSDATVTGNISVKNHNTSLGQFDVIVSNINSTIGIEQIQIPVWSERNGQDDIIWYVAKKQSNGTYKVTVKASHHKYDTGTYHVHAYLDSKGKRYGLGTTTTSMQHKVLAGKHFVDVSSHNGTLSVSDYRTLLSKGITGVVVKLTEGTSYTNPYAASQVRNAQVAGLKVSTYHYSHFTTTRGAQAEARYFVAAAKKLNLSTSTVMVNDIEEDKSRLNINTNMKAWETEMRRLGYGNLVHYAGASWLDTNRLGYSGPIKTSQFGLRNFWVAHYPYLMGMTAEQANRMKYYSTSAAWQFTSKARLLTGRSYFDLNIDYTGRFTK